MAQRQISGKYVKFFLYLIVVVLLNVAGTTLFLRLDLTQNDVYSLSDVSKQVVATLSEPLTINVFFTQNLPAPHNGTEQYLRDLLEEYAIYANQYFNYRFFDVSANEGTSSAKAQTNQAMADSYGINPIQIQMIEQDEVKFKKAYMGLVLIHGDIIERIPTITSTDGLEYRLTTAITKMNNKISALLGLTDSIRVKLFMSSSLKAIAPHMDLEQMIDLPDQVQTIVDRLNRRHFGKLAYSRHDPSRDPQAAAEIESRQYNLLSLKWPDFPDKNIASGQGVIGLVLAYGDEHRVLPLMSVLRLPIIGTRYELMEAQQLEEAIAKTVESLIDINEDLGYLASHDTLPLTPRRPANPNMPTQPEAAVNFRTLVSRSYSLKQIDLTSEPIPTGIQCLVIARPLKTFSDYELFQLDQFLVRGGHIVMFVDRFNELMPPAQMGMQLGQGPQFIPLETGLEKLLSHYGLRIKQSLVMDENCFKQELDMRQGGGERPIYFAPLIENRFINEKLPFMKNIKRLIAVKASPLELIEDRLTAQDLTAHRLLASSERSWEMRDRINLNPMMIVPPASADKMGSRPLAYLLEGSFRSYFDGKRLPVKEVEKPDAEGDEKTGSEGTKDAEPPPTDNALSDIEAEGGFVARGQPGKLMLMASSEMIKDTVLDAEGQTTNSLFVMNLLDALNNREDIALLRSKRQRFNPLEPTGDATRTLIKTLNIVGLPLLVVVFGLIIWSRRSARKRRIHELFKD